MSKTSNDKIIFLDRDGVINEFPGVGNYVTSWEQFRFIPRSREALVSLTQAGYEINIVSNQGCVSRGLISRQGLDEITRRMSEEVRAVDGRIGGVFYCVHQTNDDCECRKPKIALFQKALKGRGVDLKGVYFVGDSQEDIQASRNLGCRSVLVLSGRLGETEAPSLNPPPDAIKKDLWDAAHWIIAQKS